MDNNNSSITTIDEYINQFPQDIQQILETIRITIKEAAPDAVERINYGMPTFALYGNLVHFAAFKKHVGLYPAPSGIDAFKGELSLYKCAKGSVQFPLDKPMPYDLITRIVKFRVDENIRIAKEKKNNKY